MFEKLGTGSKEQMSGNIPFVNLTTINWNQIPGEALGLFCLNLRVLETELGK